LVSHLAQRGSQNLLWYHHWSSLLDLTRRLYQENHFGYQSFRKLGHYRKNRKNPNGRMRTRKLDHSLSLSHYHSPLQFLQYQRYQLQFQTKRKQNDV
jgi:hypothetical protein